MSSATSAAATAPAGAGGAAPATPVPAAPATSSSFFESLKKTATYVFCSPLFAASFTLLTISYYSTKFGQFVHSYAPEFGLPGELISRAVHLALTVPEGICTPLGFTLQEIFGYAQHHLAGTETQWRNSQSAYEKFARRGYDDIANHSFVELPAKFCEYAFKVAKSHLWGPFRTTYNFNEAVTKSYRNYLKDILFRY